MKNEQPSSATRTATLKIIAQEAGCSIAMVRFLCERMKYTQSAHIAKTLGKYTDQPAISFVSPHLRDVFERAYPKAMIPRCKGKV